jgi:hypothetical protein
MIEAEVGVIARGKPTLSIINGTKPADATIRNGAFGNLPGGVPVTPEGRQRSLNDGVIVKYSLVAPQQVKPVLALRRFKIPIAE